MLETAVRKITVSEYHKMAEVGIIQPDEKVELINGEIVYKMSPVNKRHASHVKGINELLVYRLYKQATIGVQDPIFIQNHSAPEPDISVLKYSENHYVNENIDAQNAFLVIEVSDSTLKKDQTTKLQLYASANIPEYWIVNLVDNCIEVFKNPKSNFYQQHFIMTDDDILELPFGKSLIVSEILK